MTRDVKVAINLKETTSALAESILQGALTLLGGDGISAGISALVKAVTSIRIDSEPGEKAWALAMLCFSLAISDLKSLPDTDEAALREVFRDAFNAAKAEVDQGEQYVPANFLDRPTTLPVYQLLRDIMVAKKDVFRPNVVEAADVLKYRLDAAFNLTMFEMFVRRQDLFNSLMPALSSPGVKAAEQELNWITYRKKLIYDFEVKPVFGQEGKKISLSQLYVGLRGYWPKENLDPKSAKMYDLRDTHEIGQLDELLNDWLHLNIDDDFIRLIGGGPGSGKSTTLKALTRKVADRLDLRPLFVPLQHIDLEGNLRDSINRFFLDTTNSPFTRPPLARESIEDGPPLLLIFDGLDELAKPGEAANEVISLFSSKLMTLISALKGDGGKQIKVIISGRMPAFQAAMRHMSPPKAGCIEVYGFTGLAPGKQKKKDLWNNDQRATWWIKYAKVTGAAVEIPPAFKSRELQSITHEPLLCYLLVLSGFATTNWKLAAENPNRIYKTLIDSVWERGWGEGTSKRQGPGKTLTKRDFNILMQTIALAAWQGGDTRVASESDFYPAIGMTQAGEAWNNFKRDSGSDVTNLAMNFYLKASEGRYRGFEFTHKSFGDYLAARSLLDVAYDVRLLLPRRVDHAIGDWLKATGAGLLTDEVLKFLRDEVRLRVTEKQEGYSVQEIITFKEAFESLVNVVLLDGFPAGIGNLTWRAAEARQRNAEVMLWAILNSLSLTLEVLGKNEEKLVKVEWPNSDSLHFLLTRLRSSVFLLFEHAAFKCFANIVAPHSQLFGLNLAEVDLHGAQMAHSSFFCCVLISANMENADFTGSHFSRAFLVGASFDNSVLTRSSFVDAILQDTSFEDAQLEGCVISESSLIWASLQKFKENSKNLFYRKTVFEVSKDERLSFFEKVSSVQDLLNFIPEENVVVEDD